MMYQMNELDLWRQRQDALVQEAEQERLARQLRATRSKRSTPFWAMFLDRVHGRGLDDALDSLGTGEGSRA